MQQQELIPHLFRTEFSKIVAVLCRQFGLAQIEMAEDIASETFLSALETWPYQGLPKNPTAWLYTVAKNKTKNYCERLSIFEKKIAPALTTLPDLKEAKEPEWSDAYLKDSQLKMLFALCHPSLTAEAQIALSLRILCGFGIEEIATAFLTSKETVNKRLYRARETLRQNPITLEWPSAEAIERQLDTVLKTLYLLFSEGYYSESSDFTLRKDLCLDAMHLVHLLTEHDFTNRPAANALLSLMCFQASRFDARYNDNGELVLYDEQDERLWNEDLIAQGAFYLHKAAAGNKLSSYHLEASIAYWHTRKEPVPEKWETILQLYNQLLLLQYSPIAALNRTYALAKLRGAKEAISEAESLHLTGNRFYYALLGELYKEFDAEKAAENFQKALSLTKKEMERRVIQKKLNQLFLLP